MPIQIGLIGSLGKMGHRIRECILKDQGLFLAWELHSKSPRNSVSKADVIIDFSSVGALRENLALAKTMNTPLVIGTTGLRERDFEDLEHASQNLPIFWAPNFSFGMSILIHALKILSPLLQKKFIPYIEETHHVHKKDKPSGTALACAKAIEETYALPTAIESFRTGEVIGDHSVFFLAEDEKLTFRHEALSGDAFALGALQAAKFLVDKKPGLYSMESLLLSTSNMDV